MSMNAEPFRTYAEFWPYYLSEHSRRLTRGLHYCGTSLALFCLIAAALSGALWLLPAALVSGYFFAWVGHFFVERNRPATFRYPFWSLAADFHMYGLWLRGRLRSEIERVGL